MPYTSREEMATAIRTTTAAVQAGTLNAGSVFSAHRRWTLPKLTHTVAIGSF